MIWAGSSYNINGYWAHSFLLLFDRKSILESSYYQLRTRPPGLSAARSFHSQMLILYLEFSLVCLSLNRRFWCPFRRGATFCIDSVLGDLVSRLFEKASRIA